MLFVFNLYRASQKNWNYADPLDYRGLYIGGKLFMENEVLYTDSIGGDLWRSIKEKEGFESTTDFGNLYASVSLYPPQAFIPFLPLSFLPWKMARVVWWFICTLSLFWIGWLAYKYKRDNTIWAIILALSPTYFAWSLGQPMLPVMALLFTTVFIYKQHPKMAGLLLGIAMMKFSIAIPFALWFLAQKQYRLLAIGAVTSLLMFVPLVVQNFDVISQWLHKTSWYYEFMYTPDEQNIYTFSDSELSMLLHHYFPQDVSNWKIINMVGQLIGFTMMVVGYRKRWFRLNHLLLGLLLVSFVFTYHLTYDALLFVIPLCLFNYNKIKSEGAVLLLFLLVLSLPLSILGGVIPLIKFNYAILCAIGLVVFIFARIKARIIV